MTDEVQLPPGDTAPEPAQDPNVAVSAVAPSSTVETASAPTVSDAAGVSQPAASSPAETFEQRVEARFLALEQHFMNLPHAIAQANGHPEPASWGSRVLNFLFGKNEEPSA